MKVTGKSVVVTGGASGILPHPRVGASFLRKATDYDAWLSRTRDRLAKMGQPPR